MFEFMKFNFTPQTKKCFPINYYFIKLLRLYYEMSVLVSIKQNLIK